MLRHYEATLAACDALDYHDFINFAVSLLEKNSEGTSLPISDFMNILCLLAMGIL